MTDDTKKKTTDELFRRLSQVKMYPIDRQPISAMPPVSSVSSVAKTEQNKRPKDRKLQK